MRLVFGPLVYTKINSSESVIEFPHMERLVCTSTTRFTIAVAMTVKANNAALSNPKKISLSPEQRLVLGRFEASLRSTKNCEQTPGCGLSAWTSPQRSVVWMAIQSGKHCGFMLFVRI